MVLMVCLGLSATFKKKSSIISSKICSGFTLTNVEHSETMLSGLTNVFVTIHLLTC